MPQNKYDIPSQVQNWAELNQRFSQAEIVKMCDEYLRSKERGKLTRKSQTAQRDLLKRPDVQNMLKAQGLIK